MANEGYGNFENAATDGTAPAVKPDPTGKAEADPAKTDTPETGESKPAMPAAGPHADPALTNHAATPGAGAMAEGPAPGNDPDPGTG